MGELTPSTDSFVKAWRTEGNVDEEDTYSTQREGLEIVVSVGKV